MLRAWTGIQAGNGFVALGRSGGRSELTLAGENGAPLRGRGVAPGSLSAVLGSVPLLVVADYSLLTDAAVGPALAATAPTVRIGLVPPDRLDPAFLSAEAVARAWSGASPRAVLSAADVVLLAPFLAARERLTARAEHVREELRGHLASVAPGYAALVDTPADLDRLLPIVRDHPTPRALRAAGTIALNRQLQEVQAGVRHRLVETLLSLPPDQSPSEDPLRHELVEALVPGIVDELTLTLDRVLRLDRAVHRIASHDAFSPRLALPLSLLRSRGAEPRRSTVGDRDPRVVLAEVRAAVDRLRRLPIQPMSIDEQFRAAYVALGSPDDASLTPRELLEVELAGQRVSLAAGDFRSALRHRNAAEALLEHELHDDPETPVRLLADARIVAALTEVLVIDLATGFANLRSALEADTAREASPDLSAEALGFLALILLLFGERQGVEDILALAQARADGLAAGPMLAPARIARLFLLGSRISTDAAGRAELVAAAHRTSQGTAYWPFFHYVVMLTSYVSKDSSSALLSFTEIQRDGQWAQSNPRFDRLSHLSYAAHLAAQGEFTAAHRELSRLAARGDSRSDGADDVIHGLISLRLELAAGKNRRTIAMTSNDGVLGEHQIQGTHLRRYVSAVLLLRGSAFAQQGARAAAAELFLRATQQAHLHDEYLALACAETREYREWLEGLDLDRLPTALPREVVTRLLASPPLIQRGLPTLTQQQERVLGLLALGRSTSSIAAELHISQNTIKSHLRKLYQRLEVSSRAQAVLLAESYGLLQ
ncbi:MAG: response regulator transcription factor [Salana multivorans]|uniref:LuxR C-terminal-related transcriptional regulator n=1 Tax=Salana multivorans TaxID=120377 RepID=UPI000967430F|nr:LuxR C-terminal-related transcriptional regulator [Salana multivorans]MBN8882079.1 response regulator transcription factor [Salana multivorans]OJX94353.1 MAG: hypothetical protein BGO96_15755 [Micrococcales bacterium 73-15]